MDFQESLNVMSIFMNQNPESGYLFGNKRQEVDKSIREMIADLDLNSSNKPVELNRQLLNIVKNNIRLMRDVTMNAPLTKDFSNFIDAYFQLVDNWNQISAKDEEIPADMNVIWKYKELHFTTAELITQAKDLLKRFKNLSNFALPAMEMSKHYLKRFDERVAQKGGDNKRQIHTDSINEDSLFELRDKSILKKDSFVGTNISNATQVKQPTQVIEMKSEIKSKEEIKIKTGKLKFN